MSGSGDRVYHTRVVDTRHGGSEKWGLNIFADPEEAKKWLEGYVEIRFDAEPGEWREEQSAEAKWSMYPDGFEGRAVVDGWPIREDAEELLEQVEETMVYINVETSA